MNQPRDSYCSTCEKVIPPNEVCLHTSRSLSVPPISDNIASNDHVIKRSNTFTTSTTISEMCDEHTSEPVKFYCEPCNHCVCSECIVSTHNGHRMNKLENQNERKALKLEENLRQLEKNKAVASKDLEYVEKLENTFQGRVNCIEKEIHKRSQLLKNLIDNSAVELCKKLKKEKTEKFAAQKRHLREEIERFDQASMILKNTNVRSCKIEAVEDYSQALLHNIVSNLKDPDITFQPSKFLEKCQINLVGSFVIVKKRLENIEKLFFATEVDSSLRGLAIDDMNLYVVCGKALEIKKLNLKDWKVESTFKLDAIRHPYHFEVFCGNMYVTDYKRPVLYIIDLSDGALREVEIASPRSTLSRSHDGSLLLNQINKLSHISFEGETIRNVPIPGVIQDVEHAIHIDEQQYVLVSFQRKDLFKIGNGSILKTFGNKSANALEPCYLALDDNRNIYVCDYITQKVLVLTENLEYIRFYKINGWPWGVYIDRFNSRIFVAFSNQEKSSTCISAYDLVTDCN